MAKANIRARLAADFPWLFQRHAIIKGISLLTVAEAMCSLLAWAMSSIATRPISSWTMFNGSHLEASTNFLTDLYTVNLIVIVSGLTFLAYFIISQRVIHWMLSFDTRYVDGRWVHKRNKKKGNLND